MRDSDQNAPNGLQVPRGYQGGVQRTFTFLRRQLSHATIVRVTLEDVDEEVAGGEEPEPVPEGDDFVVSILIASWNRSGGHVS